MIEGTFGITWKFGLAERSAPLLAKRARCFKSRIKVRKDDLEANGKSFMGLMLLAAETGSKITVTARGHDEREALHAISKLFADIFSSEGWAC